MIIRTAALFFLLITLPFEKNLNAQLETDLMSQIPKEINGWISDKNDRIFDEETLFDYIDGGAELFISFGFSKVVNRTYHKDGQPDIIIDAFYMNSSSNAFGAFSHSVGKIGNDFGMQSQTAEGAILFWKGKYYISILTYPETSESKKTIEQIAQKISELISENGEFPLILSKLPKENLIGESIRYFRHYVWLNSHGFISNENIFNISQETECVIAQYSNVKDTANLLLIEYKTSEEADLALEKFISIYDNRLAKNKIIERSDKFWVGIEKVDKYLIGVFNCTSEKFATELFSLAGQINNKIE
jgi:hypothetical protein